MSRNIGPSYGGEDVIFCQTKERASPGMSNMPVGDRDHHTLVRLFRAKSLVPPSSFILARNLLPLRRWGIRRRSRCFAGSRVTRKIKMLAIAISTPVRVQTRGARMSGQVLLRRSRNEFVVGRLIRNLPTFRAIWTTIRDLCRRQHSQQASSRATPIPGYGIPRSGAPCVSGFHPPTVCLRSALGNNTPQLAQLAQLPIFRGRYTGQLQFPIRRKSLEGRLPILSTNSLRRHSGLLTPSRTWP